MLVVQVVVVVWLLLLLVVTVQVMVLALMGMKELHCVSLASFDYWLLAKATQFALGRIRACFLVSVGVARQRGGLPCRGRGCGGEELPWRWPAL